MPELIGLITGLVVLASLFKPLFGNFDGFAESVKYSFIPDIVSFFKGEYKKDRDAQSRLGLWFIAGGVAGGLAWYFAAKAFN